MPPRPQTYNVMLAYSYLKKIQCNKITSLILLTVTALLNPVFQFQL